MNPLRWLWPASIRSQVLSLFKRGMSRDEKSDRQGAFEAYTLAIEHAGAPDDLKAMALYNRALLLAANRKTEEALDDLRTAMELPGCPANVKLSARRRVERLQHRRAGASHSKGQTSS